MVISVLMIEPWSQTPVGSVEMDVLGELPQSSSIPYHGIRAGSPYRDLDQPSQQGRGG